jgi:hypothetical protein
MITFLKNKLLGRYQGHPEAVIISCFFNPMNSPYRRKAFNIFYESIKHLNHRVVECIIGDSKPQLPENRNIQRVYTENLLWHKEALLNYLITKLPAEFKYVFWVDADVIFSNKNWLTESVWQMENGANILQPFQYCVHLNQDELKPSFDVDEQKMLVGSSLRHKQLWRSFCANYCVTNLASSDNYDRHGHVGFAWGARREVLAQVLLYDKALIGGADHIIAHAAAGHIPHSCIKKAFKDDIDEVNAWSHRFYRVVKGEIGYADGDLYHIWHGDIDRREYLKRIQDFTVKTKAITQKDKNGLYITHRGDDEYVKRYFRHREVRSGGSNYGGRVEYYDDGFLQSMMIGYLSDNAMIGTVFGGNPMGAIIGDMLNNGSPSEPPDGSVGEQPAQCSPECSCECDDTASAQDQTSENFS